MAELSATVIADSISEAGERLTTMVLSMPQSLMTGLSAYRALSRTTTPSHTTDISSLISEVLLDGYVPSEPLTAQFRSSWLHARDNAVVAVVNGVIGQDNLSTKLRKNIDANRKTWGGTPLDAALVTKEIRDFTGQSGRDFVNELLLLDPFTWTTCLVSATDWSGFTALGSHGSSGPDTSLGGLATLVRYALDESTPTELSEGQWHLPFLTDEEKFISHEGSAADKDKSILSSVARCGGASLRGVPLQDVDSETQYAVAALRRGYVSVWEHVATPTNASWGVDDIVDGLPSWRGGDTAQGNFSGWTQARKLVDFSSVLDSDENLFVIS